MVEAMSDAAVGDELKVNAAIAVVDAEDLVRLAKDLYQSRRIGTLPTIGAPC